MHEDVDGNVVGIAQDEGGMLLFAVFNAEGNYLYNRNYLAPGQQHNVKELDNGSYLISSVEAFSAHSTLSSYPFVPFNSCDDIRNIDITNGVDSMADAEDFSITPGTLNVSDFVLETTTIGVVAEPFCTAMVGIVEDDLELDRLIVYPNPASGFLYVRNNNPIPVQAMLYDVMGRSIMKKNFVKGDNAIDISSIHTGIYFLSTTSECVKFLVE